MNKKTSVKKRRLVLRNTGDRGKGVFANASVERGTLIIEYKGQRRRWSEFGGKDDLEYVFLMDIEDDNGQFVIDPRYKGNLARFINHSCAPNCEAISHGKRVFIQSLRKIKVGEEITYDYQLELGTKPTRKDRLRFPCACGATKCRGTLLAKPS